MYKRNLFFCLLIIEQNTDSMVSISANNWFDRRQKTKFIASLSIPPVFNMKKNPNDF